VNPDLILAGAGLASSLIAVSLAQVQPGTRILVLDRARGPSDGHTWSFHDSDVSPDWHRRLAPAIRARWQGQVVRFPDHARSLRSGYASVSGERLAALLAATPGVSVRWGSEVAGLDAAGATLATGERIEAACVMDGRGAHSSRHLVTGYQKFVGLEFEMDTPHGIAQPVIMDATVEQQDGYRFVYLLPFSPTRLLVEDTRYSDGSALDEDAIALAIHAYTVDHGWRGREVRRERGVLPIALAHDAPGFWTEAQGGSVPVGLRAGLFHPVTGYSLPVAAQVADVVAATRPLSTAGVFAEVRAHALARAKADRFLRLLNRMLFCGCAPERRHRVLSRFYRLPEPLIERFYAGRLTPLDCLRIVTGKPPIPLRDALRCLREAPLLKERA
jgi:lycopene beta-cyclase